MKMKNFEFDFIFQVLYRLKEKAHISDGQLKAPPRDLHLTLTLPPKSAPSPRGTRVRGCGPTDGRWSSGFHITVPGPCLFTLSSRSSVQAAWSELSSRQPWPRPPSTPSQSWPVVAWLRPSYPGDCSYSLVKVKSFRSRNKTT